MDVLRLELDCSGNDRFSSASKLFSNESKSGGYSITDLSKYAQNAFAIRIHGKRGAEGRGNKCLTVGAFRLRPTCCRVLRTGDKRGRRHSVCHNDELAPSHALARLLTKHHRWRADRGSGAPSRRAELARRIRLRGYCRARLDCRGGSPFGSQPSADEGRAAARGARGRSQPKLFGGPA
jgi:hypothetical protein